MSNLHRTLAAMAMAAFLTLATGCTSGLGELPQLQSAGPVELRLAPGDKVRIAVVDLEAMDGDYVVDETGTVSLPLIERITAAGLSYNEMQAAIASRLVQADVLRSPNVTVQPLELRPIYIMGEVRTPGEYAYRQGLTVFAAVSMAGGYTYRAQTGEVAVTRTVDNRSVTAVADEESVILPGDRIMVHERWF